MFGNAYKVTEAFGRLGTERGVIGLKINRFKLEETGVRAYIAKCTGSNEDRLFVRQSRIRNNIEESSNVCHAQQPEMRWCACTVHDAIDNMLKCLISPFKLILVLVIGFTLPESDP